TLCMNRRLGSSRLARRMPEESARGREPPKLIYIAAIHMSGERDQHEDIETVRWWQPTSPVGGRISGEGRRRALVDWMRRKGGEARVVDEAGDDLEVRIVEADPPYLRTFVEGVWTDNLLALPRY